MANQLLSEKYSEALYGVLNCYDRVIISGNLHPLCYAQGSNSRRVVVRPDLSFCESLKSGEL